MKKLVVLLVLVSVTASCKKKSKQAAPVETATTTPTAPAATDTPVDQALAARATLVIELNKIASAGGKLKVEQTGKLIDATVTAIKASSREAWDPAAIVAKVGKDRAALFAWVRDQTALVPYRGSLRGVIGVLMDRVGNSLDRALLLAALLETAGLEVRLATAQLDPEATAKLAASWSTHAKPALPVATLDSAALVGDVIKVLGVDATAFRGAYDKAIAAREEIAAKARARVTDQAAALTKLVPAPTEVPAPLDPAVFADHWWVQVKDGEAWTDLDPSLATGTPPAAETFAPKDLPEDRRHTLTVRVIGEVWHGDAREETPLVEHTFAPALYYGQKLTVTSVAIDMPSHDALGAAKDPAIAMRSAIVAQTEWVPMVRMGTGVVAKMSVTDGGELFDVTDPNGNTNRLARAVQKATKDGVGGATDLLSGLPDDTAATAPPIKPARAEQSGFTAQWIEYELRAPGEEPRIIRRSVFDALGADRSRPRKLDEAARLERGLALMGETEVLPMFAAIPEDFVADRLATMLTAAKPVLLELVALEGKPPSKELSARIAAVPSGPGPLYDLALARFTWSSVGEQVYLDRLNVLAQSRRVIVNGAEVRMRDAFDIVANAISPWPSAGTNARAARIVQGITDTVAETALLACPRSSKQCARGINTSDEFAVPGRRWTVASSADSPELARLPASVQKLAAADLASGYSLVVPPGARGAAPATWWRMHPQTGEILGMGALGGTEMTEYFNLGLGILGWGTAQAFCSLQSHSWAQWAACSAAADAGLLSALAAFEGKKAAVLATVTGFIAWGLTVGAYFTP